MYKMLFVCPSWGDLRIAGSTGILYQMTGYSKEKGAKYHFSQQSGARFAPLPFRTAINGTAIQQFLTNMGSSTQKQGC